MKIYIVNCGKYDCCGIELATEKIELAIKLIAERVHLDGVFDCFSDMECWENGKMLYRYTTKEKLESGISEEINKIELELIK